MDIIYSGQMSRIWKWLYVLFFWLIKRDYFVLLWVRVGLGGVILLALMREREEQPFWTFEREAQQRKEEDCRPKNQRTKEG